MHPDYPLNTLMNKPVTRMTRQNSLKWDKEETLRGIGEPILLRVTPESGIINHYSKHTHKRKVFYVYVFQWCSQEMVSEGDEEICWIKSLCNPYNSIDKCDMLMKFEWMPDSSWYTLACHLIIEGMIYR